MQRIQTLEHTSHADILQVFNDSFSDYLVPFSISAPQFENKIQNEGIRLEFSAGVFEEERLVAFILHGYGIVDDQKMLYNAGTGVLPSFRGKHLTRQLYQFLMPKFQSMDIRQIQLEVIVENIAAIKTYGAIGFVLKRTLNCYKGSLLIPADTDSFDVRPLKEFNWDNMQSFWDYYPTWQNSIRAVENGRSKSESLGIYKNERLVGYIIFNPSAKRIQQFAIHKNYRFQELGTKLFSQAANNFGNDVSIINVDEAATETNAFLQSVGLQIFTRQFEMELKLK
jgi:ribosomal protein S18 acetylase RimI-like enzyme